MNCRHVEPLLSNHLEGRLAERASRQVTAHLEGCLDCLRLRDEMAAVGQDLRELPDALPAVDLRRTAIERWIAERGAAQPGRWRGSAALGQATRRTVWLTGAAVALLVAWSLVLAPWEHHPENQERPRELALRPHAPPPPRYRAQQSPGAEHRHGKLALSPEHPGKSALDAITQALRPNAQHLRPNAQRPPHGDLAALNGDPIQTAREAAALPADEWDRIAERVRQTIRVRDDFVSIPFPRVASIADGQVADAFQSYKREAAIVDTRLSREVTLAAKATALSDLCDQICSATGIRVEAGRSVADEKVTVFCDKMPLRDVMRQLSRPFGYTWLRTSTLNAQRSTLNDAGPSIEHRASSIEYRYELVQDLRSQLLEEELRNRDRNAALLALSKEMERYRPYLGLSPDEALTRSRTALPDEKKLLETLGGWGWGPIQIYFRLSPQEWSALRAGQTLTFSQEPKPGEWPLPPDMTRGVLDCLRDVRVVRRDGGYDFAPGSHGLAQATPAGVGIPLAAVPEARAGVRLSLNQSAESELGRLTLDGSSRFSTGPHSPGGGFSKAPYAVGISRAVLQPQNALANAQWAHDPALRLRVTVRPEPSCGLGAGHEAGDRLAGQQAQQASTPQLPSLEPKITSADVLQALHQATGMPVVADNYTRLYALRDLSVRTPTSLFDALNHLADGMRMRWDKDGTWLRFRSTSYYDDRLKEVPNRLLTRWAASRREHGELTLDDLVEIAGLSDAQLDAAAMAEGARECWGLAEWELARPRSARPFWRFLSQLASEQRQQALSTAGLAFTRMSLAQQQQFLAVARAPQADPPPSLQELAEAMLRLSYTQPGGFEWPGTGSPILLQFRPSPVRERTREAALQMARRFDPQVEPEQILPTDLAVTILLRCGVSPDAYVHIVRITPRGATGYDGRPSRR